MDLLRDDGHILLHLKNNLIALKEMIYGLHQNKLNIRYTEGKWTIKQILVHLIDDERIFTYRKLRYARNDKTPLHGFDENLYTLYSEANDRSLESILEEYESVRNATITLFKHMPETALLRSGKLDDNINNRTVRALAYHIAGHEIHHLNVIKEKYL